jgi:hypothetical protein
LVPQYATERQKSNIFHRTLDIPTFFYRHFIIIIIDSENIAADVGDFFVADVAA